MNIIDEIVEQEAYQLGYNAWTSFYTSRWMSRADNPYSRFTQNKEWHEWESGWWANKIGTTGLDGTKYI